MPFGGRSKELAYLDRWVSDPASPSRLVVVGQAGRGKSALLVNWVTRLTTAAAAAREGSWQLVFVPISIRFNTNRPAVFYEAIAARLAEIAECELRPAHNDPAAYYEDQCRVLVETILSRDQSTLIVIDGADEALGDGFGARWFPRQGGGRLRLLISARLQIGDVDATGWVRRLGWDRGVRYATMQLPSLDIAGVRNLLITTGAPLDILAARPDIIDKLHRLSEGEPLILRLYVEDLWSRTQGSQELTVEDLDHIQPGLAGYFEDWLARQRDLWREDGKNGVAIDSELMAVQLALLACAHGPLAAEDLGALLRHCGCQTRGLRIEDGLEPLRRFVIGTGKRFGDGYHGYVLSHPRFGQFLYEDYLDESQVRDARSALAQWGDDIVQRSNAGLLRPDQVPVYVLNYHSQHLADAGFASDGFMRMVEPGWLRAWEAHEGAYHGFSKDVAVAARMLLLEQPRMRNWRSSLVRCALFQTSIANLAAQVPEDILLPCVQAGVMSVRQVLHWLEFHPPATRCRILVDLAPLLDDATVPTALDSCRAISEAALRARALAAVATRLTPDEQHTVASELMSILEMEQSERVRFLQVQNSRLLGETLSAVAGFLDPAQMEQAAGIGAAMALDEHRVAAFLALGRVVAPDRRPALFRQALSGLHAVAEEARRCEFLESLAPYLTLDLLYPVISAVNFDGPLESLAALMTAIPESFRILAYEAAIRLHLDAEAATRPRGRAKRHATAAAILRTLPPDRHAFAVTTALGFITGLDDYLECLSALGALIPESVIQAIARHASAMLDAHGFAAVVSALAPLLSTATADQVLAIALDLDREGAKAESIIALVSRMSDQAVADILPVVSRLTNEQDRGRALAAMMAWLPMDHVDGACDRVRRLTDRCLCVEGLLAAAARLDEPDQATTLDEALSVTRVIENRHERQRALLDCIAALHGYQGAGCDSLLLECLRQTVSLENNGAFLQAFKALAAPLQQSFGARATVGSTDETIAAEPMLALCTKLLERLSTCRSLIDLEPIAAWVPAPLLAGLLDLAARLTEAHWEHEFHARVVATALRRLPVGERAVQIESFLQRCVGAPYFVIQDAVHAVAPYMAELWAEEEHRFTAAAQSSRLQMLVLKSVASMLTPADRERSLAATLQALRDETRGGLRDPSVLVALLPLLPFALRVEAIKLALDSSPTTVDQCLDVVPEDEHETLLAEVLEQLLAARPIEQVLTLIRRWRRNWASSLAPAAQRLRSEMQRTAILGELVGYMGDSARTGLVGDGLANPDQRPTTPVPLEAALPAEQAVAVLQEALRASMTIGDELQQASVLGVVLDHLPDGMMAGFAAQLVARLAALRDPHARCALLQAASRTLDPAQLRSLLADELAAALTEKSANAQSAALRALAPLLSEDQCRIAWQAAVRIGDPHEMLQAVAGLLPLVPAALVGDLLRDLHRLPDETRVRELLAMLAPNLPLAHLPAFFSELATLEETGAKFRALFAISARVTGPERLNMLGQVIAFARNSEDAYLRARALVAAIESGVPATERAAWSREALDAVFSMSTSQGANRAAALEALAPHLTPQLVLLALHEAALWVGPYGYGAAIAALRPVLAEDTVQWLVAETASPWVRMEVLAAFGAGLPTGAHARAFTVLQDWTDDTGRIKAQAKLLPSLNDELRNQALTALAEAAARVPRRVIFDVLADFLPAIVASEGPDGGAMQIGRAVLDVGECIR